LVLEDYNYTIKHRPRTRLKYVDALSRYPVMAISPNCAKNEESPRGEDEEIKKKKSLEEGYKGI